MEKNKILIDAFKWLFIGLLVCFGASYVSISNENIWYFINSGGFVLFSLIGVVVIAIVLSSCINKLNPMVAKILYLIDTALIGTSISWVFLAYTGASITFIFLVTAIIFGIFALIGKTTNADLSKFGIYLGVALFAIILLELINIFVMNNILSMGLCIIGIVVFAGYVAYDIKFALEKAIYLNPENAGIYCALQLFLDFINLFLRLLQLFGKSRD